MTEDEIKEAIFAAMMEMIERLRALLNDKDYISCKADYNRGHLSHYGYLQSREQGLGLNGDEQRPGRA